MSRTGQVKNRKVSRIGMCQNWKVSVMESVRILDTALFLTFLVLDTSLSLTLAKFELLIQSFWAFFSIYGVINHVLIFFQTNLYMYFKIYCA